MKVIKAGKSKEELEVILKAEKQFECKTCGCIFSATSDEYSYDGEEYTEKEDKEVKPEPPTPEEQAAIDAYNIWEDV